MRLQKKFLASLCRLTIVLIALAMFNTQALALDNRWINPGGGNWSTPDNWSLGWAPQPSEDVIIDLAGTYTVTADTNITAASVTVGGNDSAPTLVLNSKTINAPLTNLGTIIARGSSALNRAFANQTGGVLTVEGNSFHSHGAMTVASGFSNYGEIILTNSTTGYHATLIVTTGTLTNYGTIKSLAGLGSGYRNLTAQLDNQGIITGDNSLTINKPGATLNNSGAIELTNGSLTISEAASFANSGTIMLNNGNGNMSSSASFINNGMITINTGDCTIASTETSSNSGTITAANGNITLYLNKSTSLFTNTGTITIGPGKSLTISSGQFEQQGSLGGTGTLSLTGTVFTLPSALSLATDTFRLSASSSTINGAGSLRNEAGNITWLYNTTVNVPLTNEGEIQTIGPNSFNGAFSNQNGATLTIIGFSSPYFGNTMAIANGFNNHGTITLIDTYYVGSVILAVASGSLVNYGTIKSLRGVSPGSRIITAQLDNQGTITGDNSLTVNKPGATLNNSGAIELTNGSLTISEAANVTNSGTIMINNGNVNSTSSANFINNGMIAINTGDVNGTIINSARFANSGMIVVGTGNCAIGSSENSSNSGTITASNGNITLYLRMASNHFTNSGEITIGPGSTMTINSGQFEQQRPIRWIGLLSLTGTIFSLPSDLSFSTDTLRLSASSSTINGAGSLRNEAGNVTWLYNTTVNVPLTNEGEIQTIGPNSFNGAFSNQNGATLTIIGYSSPYSGNTMTIANGFNNHGTITLIDTYYVGSATLAVASGSLVNYGTIKLMAGSYAGARTISAQIDNQGTITGDNSLTINKPGATLNNSGAIELTNGSLTISEAANVTNSGTIMINNGNGNMSSSASFTNSGMITINTGDCTIASTENSSNSGTITASNGNITLYLRMASNHFTNSGEITIGTGKTMSISSGQFEQQGSLGGTGSMSLTGTVFTLPSALSLSTDTFRLSAVSSTINGAGSLHNAAGNVTILYYTTINVPVTNEGEIVSVGTNFLNGVFSNQNGATLTIIGLSSAYFGNTTVIANGFNNHGTITLIDSHYSAGSVTLAVTSGSLVNYGTIKSMAGVYPGSRIISAQLDNQGTITGDNSLTINKLGATLNNSGAIELTNGSLTISEAANVSNSGTIMINNGNVNSTSSANFINNGMITINTGGANGTIINSARFANSGMILIGTGNCAIGSSENSSNSGTITASNGNITLYLRMTSNHFTNSGEITIGPGSTMTISSGQFEQQGSLGGTGTLSLTGTVFTLPSALSLSTDTFRLTAVSSTINGAGSLRNAAGNVTILYFTTINVPVTNEGEIVSVGTNSFNGAFSNQNGATLTIIGYSSPYFGNTTAIANGFNNHGTITLIDSHYSAGSATLAVVSGSLVNYGTIKSMAGVYPGSRIISAQLDNQGTITGDNSLTINKTSAIHNNSGAIELSNGNLAITNATSFTNSGTLLATNGNATISLLNSAGLITNSNEIMIGAGRSLTIGCGTFTNAEAGTIKGSGTLHVQNATFSNKGHLAPGGASPGTLTITGPLPATPSVAIDLEIGGATAGTDFDTLAISGAATLAGSLNISRINSYDLKAGDSFRILNAASLSGRFDTVNLPPATGGLDLAVTYGTNYVQLDTVVASSGLWLTMSDGPDPVVMNHALTYTATVTNAGPSLASQIIYSNPLPAGVSLVAAQPSQGACSVSDTVVTCELGDLAAESVATIILTVNPTVAGTLNNTASVSSSTADPDPADNTATATTTVRQEYLLSLAKDGSGSGLVRSTPAGIDCGDDCEEAYPTGSSVTITAVPAAGSAHTTWTGAPGCQAPAPCTVSLDQARLVAATFQRVYQVDVVPGTGGSISPSGPQTVLHGDDLTFTMTPASHYHLAELLVDGVAVGTETTYTLANITADHIVQARFSPDTFTITTTGDANGAISPAGPLVADYGSQPTFTMTGNPGYVVDKLTVDGVAVSPRLTYTFSPISANHELAATFKPGYIVETAAGQHGGITPTGPVIMSPGAMQAFTITPEPGYHVADVVVDGVAKGSRTAYTLVNVLANHVIASTFVKDIVGPLSDQPSASVPEGGTATVGVKLSAQPLTTVTISASIEGDGDLSISSGGTLTFTPANWNHFQALTLAAADDGDSLAGSAVLALSGGDGPALNIPLQEHDREDGDQDGIASSQDNCPEAANSDQADNDADGVGDACDQCPATPAATQVEELGCPYPAPVTALSVNGAGDGTSITLDWTGYDEAGQGDIAAYRIYAESTPFTSVAGLTPAAETQAGNFTATITSLARHTPYALAVLAVDHLGHAPRTVSPITATPTDTVPPAEVSKLAALSHTDRLALSWTAPPNADLAGFRVYFNDAATGVPLPAGQTSFEQTGLARATAYTVRVSTVDADGNESPGVLLTASTLLNNPAITAVEPKTGAVTLRWSAVTPKTSLAHYAIYVSDQPFVSVDGLRPRYRVTSTSVTVAGLNDNQTYYFAVTAVNLSKGEDKSVSPVTAAPTPDTAGPSISGVLVDGNPMSNGITITSDATLSVMASDPTGIGRVEFMVDNTAIGTDLNASDGHNAILRLAPLTDASHTLTITAVDTKGNATPLLLNFTVAQAAPATAPLLTAPANGLVTNQSAVTVSGTAPPLTHVQLLVNGAESAAGGETDANGAFAIRLTLTEGENRIQAVARNRGGSGPASPSRTVHLDTSLPGSPSALTASPKSEGLIRLTWQAGASASVKGYHLYRASHPFTTATEAQRVNQALIKTNTFDDLPPTDGAWFYRVSMVNGVDLESGLSNETQASTDATPPKATSIVYTPNGSYDAISGRVGVGVADILLTVSEPLMTTPFLSLTPANGTPLPLELSKTSATTYRAVYAISESTPSGPAHAVFSGRDLAGNRGSDIEQGGTLLIDTAGPAVTQLMVEPEGLIANDVNEPVTVTVTIGLTEQVKAGEAPGLSYLLSGPGRTETAIDTLAEIAPLPGQAQTWQGSFVLPADAGLAGPETFRLAYRGADDLGNAANTMAGRNLFQVYQGALPPLPAPAGLKAVAGPGGTVALTWEAVEGAAGYQLLRQAPGEAELTPWQRLGPLTAYTDQTTTDGEQRYAVVTIRAGHGQESISGPSAQVTAVADATPPPPPTAFTLELVPTGVQMAWQAPATAEPVTYTLYREDVAEITTVHGLPPYLVNIRSTAGGDPNPSLTDHCYTVTAVDAVGNESAPAPSAYLNFTLLPVASLAVRQVDDQAPVVSWTHPNSAIPGFTLTMGEGSGQRQVSSTTLVAKSYQDTGYSGETRHYTVTAVDAHGAKSLGRGITLLPMTATLEPGTPMRRGVMNQLNFQVTNNAAQASGPARLKVRLGGRDHLSSPFEVPANSTQAVAVVVGGYSDLAARTAMALTIERSPEANETVEIVTNSTIQVSQGMLVLGLVNEPLERGKTSLLRFTLENSGDADIDIVTATQSGQAASNEVRFTLQDSDGNTITTVPLKQSVGQGFLTLADGRTVARIPPGAIFTSEPVELKVPYFASSQVSLGLSIATVRHATGRPEEVAMPGVSSGLRLTLMETSYFAVLDPVSPYRSNGNEEIVISGRALARLDNQPVAHAKLNLTISANGFETTRPIVTDEQGNFRYVHSPQPGDSGEHRVRAVHPDLSDRPVGAYFVISRLTVSPSDITMTIPKNFTQAATLTVSAGEASTAHNLRLLYQASDQESQTLTPGIHVDSGQALTLAAKSTANLAFSLWADNSAVSPARLRLRLLSDDGDWGLVTVNLILAEAKPTLAFSPDHLEAGLAFDQPRAETITLANRGLSALRDVRLSLLAPDGRPAPEWISINSAASLGDMAAGDERQVAIGCAPRTGLVSEGHYSAILRVTSANHPTANIRLFLTVSKSGQGDALIKVSDIYTGTIDANNQAVPGLAGAQIRLQNEAVTSIERTLHSDARGEALFEGLPVGAYKYRVTAANHQEKSGRLWIQPGATAAADVFLDYTLVTVEWAVNEITIQDKYEVSLKAVYETNVPAPVLVLTPGSINLPTMQAGDVFQGEFTLTNHGLIQAEHLNFSLPPANDFFRYELVHGLPQTLAAKQSITIPYRVICLKSPSLADDGAASGGGCASYRDCATVNYDYCCVNGAWTQGQSHYCWLWSLGDCTPASAPPAPQPSPAASASYSGGGSFGSTFSSGSPAPPPAPLSGKKCLAKSARPAPVCDQCALKQSSEPFHSSVSLLLRQYNDDPTDLVVKVAGQQLSVTRRFYDNAWHFDHLDRHLAIQRETDGQGIKSIAKDGVEYQKADSGGTLFTFKDQYEIVARATGWRWQDKHGEWSEHDGTGRLLTMGNRNGSTLHFRYNSAGQLTGIDDRLGAQVLWYAYNAAGLVAEVRDSAGRTVTYRYDDQGRLRTVLDVLGAETVYSYDNKGRLASKREPGGRLSSITYDEQDNVLQVADNQGLTKRFDYDYDKAKQQFYALVRYPTGKIKEVWFNAQGDMIRTDINGRTVRRVLMSGRQEETFDWQGNVTTREYDERHNLTKVVYADGTSESTVYDPRLSAVRQKIDQRGVLTEYDYDSHGNRTRMIEAKGTAAERQTVYTYDALGNLLTSTRVADAKTREAQTTMTYDAAGNLITLTDPLGHRQHFTYDMMGNVLTRTDESGATWTYTYNAKGERLSSTDPLGNTSRQLYDGQGRLAQSIDAEGNSTRYDYDNDDHLLKVTDALDAETTFTYDADGNRLRLSDPLGHGSNQAYNADGQLVSITDANHNQTTLDYAGPDSAACATCTAGAGIDQPVRITYPTFTRELGYDLRGRKIEERDIISADETLSTQFTYDPAGNLLSKTDPEGRVTNYQYDELGRLLLTTGPMAGETRFTYDDADNLLTLTDAEGHTTTFTYDDAGQLVTETRPNGQATHYQYDANGQRTVKTDSLDQRTEHGYDQAGRLTTTRYYKNGAATPEKTVTFTYNPVGTLAAWSDGQASASFTYDALHRKTGEAVNHGPFALSHGYEYEANGLKKSLASPDGTRFDYRYDANNQLVRIGLPGQGDLTVNGYTWLQPNAITYPGGATRALGYDPLQRLHTITSQDPGGNTQQEYRYTDDQTGNITAKATEHGDYAYLYDPSSRLTRATRPAGEPEAFSYDHAGNRLTAAEVSGHYLYNANNELLAVDDSITFEYDDNGNTTRQTENGTVRQYRYDIDNRLVAVTDGQGSTLATYGYDPFGRRLWKEVAGTRTYFHYADEGLIAEADATGVITKTYGYQPDSTWGTNPLFIKQGEAYYFYQNDHLGTPQRLTATNGAVVWEASHDAFGKATVMVEEVVNNLRFPGQYYDAETGWHYNWHRYYDPATGRYRTPDPIGLAGGINLFSYSYQNPVNYTDPSGLDPYLVSRSLQGSAGAVASHNFVVSNANFLGDPNATVHSFGANNSGNVGRVDDSTRGFSARTHRDDIAAWNALRGQKSGKCEDVSPINAPDNIVNDWANSLVEDQDYAAFAGPFGANSNSAAQAIANRAAGNYVPTPGGNRLSPGAGSWKEIRFNMSVLSAAP